MEQFRSFIQNEYLKRKDRNPTYSLRSFAKSLKVDPGSLSQFMNGRRTYSLKKIKQLALILGLEKDELLDMMGSVDHKFVHVDFDRLNLLSKWYYVALLELMELDEFREDASWIAKNLGISVSLVNVALQQLFSAGVLEVTSSGKWKNNWAFFTTQKNENVDELPLREHQKQLLKLSEQSIDYNSAEEKSHTSYVAAVDVDLIPEIKDEIKRFRRKIANLISKKSKSKNSVYCMQINLFPEKVNSGGSNE